MTRKSAECSKLKEFRKLATSPQDVERVNQAYAQHLRSMFQDRVADATLCKKAQETARGEISSKEILGSAEF